MRRARLAAAFALIVMALAAPVRADVIADQSLLTACSLDLPWEQAVGSMGTMHY